jgi:hypothetical protein
MHCLQSVTSLLGDAAEASINWLSPVPVLLGVHVRPLPVRRRSDEETVVK